MANPQSNLADLMRDRPKTAAAKGDTGALLGMVRQVMQSSEGARLVQNISQAVPKEKK